MSSEQIVTIITGVLQAGGVGTFVYYLIRGLRSKIAGLEGLVSAQTETMKVMEQRVAETEKVGQIYKDLLKGLPADLENYKAIISKTKDDMIIELQNANKQKEDQLKQVRDIDYKMAHEPKGSSKHLETMRFLLDPKNEPFRKFLEQLIGDIDLVVDALVRNPNFDDLLKYLGFKLTVLDSKEEWEALTREATISHRMRGASWSAMGWYGFFENNELVISPGNLRLFSSACRALEVKLSS